MAIYRWLLRWAAPTLARDYAAAMEETLATRLREARAAGWRPRARLWRRELAALAALAWSERFGEGISGRRRRQREFNRFKAGPMNTLGQELHHAARRLWRSPAFSAATVLTLALAIGANAAIFAVVERVIINPLPYPQSDRLIDLDHGSVTLRVTSGMGSTPGIFFIYKDRAQSIESAAMYRTSDRTLAGQGEPERLRVTAASPALSTVLRTPPSVGRWFSDGEGLPGAPAVAVVSHSLWARRFGSDPGIAGRSIILDGQAFEVIGVMPPGFAFPEPRVEVWTAAQHSPVQGFGLFGTAGVARLRDDVSLETARLEFNNLLLGIGDAYPDDPRAAGNLSTKLTFSGRTLKDTVLGSITLGLWILLAAVGFLLLVACANVANLFLVRTELRHRELAIRRALGASQSGLGRYFFAESTLLALTGGGLGLFLAWGALRLLVRLGPSTMPRLHEIHLDPTSIAYTFLLSAFAAIVFGSIPLWRGAPAAALHESGRSNTASRQRHNARHTLLAAQVAMALVLLVASGLMVRSFQNLRAIDPGFVPESTLTFSVGLPAAKYGTIDATVRAHQDIIDRVAAIPGISDTSATSCLPLSNGCNGNTVLVEGETYPPGTLPPFALFRVVADRYFETMGMRIVRGRSITGDDVDRREPVAVISQALANRNFKDSDPIGRRLASNQPPARPGMPRSLEWLTIVGVVADTPMRQLNESPMPYVFMPLSLGNPAGVEGPRIAPGAGVMSFVVRTAGSPLAVVPSARHAVQEVDADLAIAQVRTLQELVDRASAQLTFTMILLAIAAGVALTLGMIGIYGVTSYIVSQRTSEIGVRLALGAEPGGITAQIVKQGGLVALAGIAVGLIGAFAGSRLIASVLYGVSPRDPIVFGVMAITLLVVALLACWIPARRAAQLSPTIALRAD